ncbi:MAG TPA: squalene--hopene cyclase [Pirellulales bacterium]|nr:squalene--hopene cyclase [Pirellulales bacterium]
MPATPDEPLAKEFSLERAARSLDASALAWQSKQQCCQCHANFMYLIARPALAKVVEPPVEVRTMYESLVSERWEKQGLRYPSEAMVVSVPLALNDRQTSRSLHPLTRKALDRMLTHQRIDGGWNPIGGSARTFIQEFEETLFAALGIAAAPDEYAGTLAAQTALDRVREYVKNHPPNTPFQKGLLLWVASHIDGLVDEADRRPLAEAFLSLQADDGGWAIENLVAGSATFEEFRVDRGRPSNGYGTGFAIFAARKAEIPVADPRLQRGIAWLKANQRTSGRWFTPTLSIGTLQNLPSNSGTALAVLALQACGEIEGDWNAKAGP